MTESQRKFVNDIYSRCSRIGVAYANLCPIAVTAQACVESNYGRSTLSKNYFNYFGLKCGKNWKGKKAIFNTKEEYQQGNLVTITAEFRAYDNMDDGVKGYYEFVDTKRYANLKNITSPFEYLSKIKDDGYATSYSYVSTCMNVVNSISPILVISENLIYQIALEVIDGKWGNGDARKLLLSQCGYPYEKIQEKVNQILKEKTT